MRKIIFLDFDGVLNTEYYQGLQQFQGKQWQDEHATPDTRYVIIDDEYVVLDSQVPYFIWTNPYEGLTEGQADRAISILHRWL